MSLHSILSMLLALSGPSATDPKSDVTALEKPISVLSKPVSAIKGDPRVTDTVPPPRFGVYRSIEIPLSRSLGSIVDQPAYQMQHDAERARRLELDRREYLLNFDVGSPAVAAQAEADAIALQNAMDQRNNELIDAANALTRALRMPSADRAQLTQQYQQKRAEIRQRYQQTRQRILGGE